MKQKKLKLLAGSVIILISLMSMHISFAQKETRIVIENTEALAGNEVNIFDLCKKAGGFCMISNTQNIFGICIDRD